MDLDLALRFGAFAVGFASIAWSVAVWRMGARKAELDKLAARIDKCEADMRADAAAGGKSRAEVAERLTAVEMMLDQVPKNEAVHKLALDVSEIRGDMKGMGESLKSVAATSRRVEEFLLSAARVK